MHRTQPIEGGLVLGISLLKFLEIGIAWKPNCNSSAPQSATIARAESWPEIAVGMHVADVFLTTATLHDTRLHFFGEFAAGRFCELTLDRSSINRTHWKSVSKRVTVSSSGGLINCRCC